MVVEPGDDFDVGAIGEAPVGEVGLPGFIRQRGLESFVGRAGAFSWLGRDAFRRDEFPADRCDRNRESVMCLEVPGDGFGPGIESCKDEFVA